MKCTQMLAALTVGLAGISYGAEATSGGFTWSYETTSDGGACVTGVTPADAENIPSVMTVPSKLGECPVTEIAGGAIGGSSWETDWLRVAEVEFPETFVRVVGSQWGAVPGSPFSASFLVRTTYDSSYTETMRNSPLAVKFQGPPPQDFKQESWGDGRVLALFTFPESGEHYDAWIEALESYVLLQESAPLAGTCLWHGLHTKQYIPQFGKRIRDTQDALATLGKAGPNEKAVCDALSALLNLSADSNVREVLGTFGVSFDGDVWAYDAQLYHAAEIFPVKFQPDGAVDALASESAYTKLTGAIASLGKVEDTWTGSVILKAEALPLLATSAYRLGPMALDAADAALLKASLEGLCAAVQLARSYRLEIDYTKALYGLSVPTIAADTPEAWDACPVRLSDPVDYLGRAQVCLQYAKLGSDLLIRVTLDGLGPEPEALTFNSETDGGWSSMHVEFSPETGTATLTEMWAGSQEVTGTVRRVTGENGRYGIVARFPGAADILDGGLTQYWSCQYDYFYCYGGDARRLPDLLVTSEHFAAERRELSGLEDGKAMAKQAFETAAGAMDRVKGRTDSNLHLFNLPVGTTAAELDGYAKQLRAAAASAETPTRVAVGTFDERIDLAALFSEHGPTRASLPTYRYGAFQWGTESDPTFCGILPDRASVTVPTVTLPPDSGLTLDEAGLRSLAELFAGETGTVTVTGEPQAIVAGIRLGIRPAEVGGASAAPSALADERTVRFELPTLTVEAFDPATGILTARVIPAGGGTLVREPLAGTVTLVGGDALGAGMTAVEAATLDTAGYLAAGDAGALTFALEGRWPSFVRVRCETPTE